MTNERTPLLSTTEGPVHEESDKVAPTPIPKLQIGVLLLVLLSEPLCSQCIYPFINQVTHHIGQYTDADLTHFQLISELGVTGGDEKKLGYYAGKQ